MIVSETWDEHFYFLIWKWDFNSKSYKTGSLSPFLVVYECECVFFFIYLFINIVHLQRYTGNHNFNTIWMWKWWSYSSWRWWICKRYKFIGFSVNWMLIFFRCINLIIFVSFINAKRKLKNTPRKSWFSTISHRFWSDFTHNISRKKKQVIKLVFICGFHNNL